MIIATVCVLFFNFSHHTQCLSYAVLISGEQIPFAMLCYDFPFARSSPLAAAAILGLCSPGIL